MSFKENYQLVFLGIDASRHLLLSFTLYWGGLYLVYITFSGNKP